MRSLRKSSSKSDSREQVGGNMPLIMTKAPISKREAVLGKKVQLPSLSKTAPSSSRSSKTNNRSYKYKIYPGNNSRVIMTSLHKRLWWHSVQPLPGDEEKNECSLNFIWEMYRNSTRYQSDDYSGVLLNHIQHNACLVTKKGLYYCIKEYCTQNNLDAASIIPLTFYLSSGDSNKDDFSEFKVFNDNLLEQANHSSSSIEAREELNSNEGDTTLSDIRENTIWILKPASRTNRGFGIKVIKGMTEVLSFVKKSASSIEECKSASCSSSSGSNSLKSPPKEASNDPATTSTGPLTQANLTKAADRIGAQKGWIVQLYMDRPLLVSGRKFDIRCYVLLTLFGKKKLKAYFYQDMYVRTSCKKYNLNKLNDRETHLTNDAVQKHSKNYGRFEDGNKLSMEELQQCINRDYPGSPGNVVEASIIPEIKRLSRVSVLAAASTLENSTIQRSFEILGYDYMLDENFKPYLIEINSNPCLEFSSALLADLISSMVENAFAKTVDVVFPPPSESHRTRSCQEAIDSLAASEDRFEAIYP